MKYLLVDDNPAMRQMIAAIVAGPEDEIVELDDGAEVVATYAEQLPDWVLMDLQMKSVGGLQAMKELKEAFPDARVIIVTQFDEKPYREQARLLKSDGFVLKDNLSELRTIIPS